MKPWKQLLAPAIAALIGVAILVGLGIWQLERREWKETLIARVESRLDAPAVPAPGPDQWPSVDLADLEYQPVRVTGRFRNDAEVHVVFALTEPKGRFRGPGYLVMTPFQTDEGWIVYVNRGFVPGDRKAPSTRRDGQIEGETTVTGLLRAPYGRLWFMPADDVSGNAWFSRDPSAYARAHRVPLAEVAPYIIDARFDASLPDGLPQGGETRVEFSNNHLQYALTWFGLAAGLAGVFIVFAWGRIRPRG